MQATNDAKILPSSDFASVNLVFGCANGFALGLAPIFLIPVLGFRVTHFLGCVFFVLGPLTARYALDYSLK